MSPRDAVGATGNASPVRSEDCAADASEEEAISLAAETPDATPAIVTPALRKSRRVVFMFEPPKCQLHVLVWPSAGQIQVFHWVNYSLRSAPRRRCPFQAARCMLFAGTLAISAISPSDIVG